MNEGKGPSVTPLIPEPARGGEAVFTICRFAAGEGKRGRIRHGAPFPGRPGKPRTTKQEV